jgi:hypothetical protein
MLVLLFLIQQVWLYEIILSLCSIIYHQHFRLSHDTQGIVETAFILSIKSKSNAIYRKTEYYALYWYQELLLF